MTGPDDPGHLPWGSCAALVLGAGKGTRMRSSLPKVLHEIAGKPMVVRVLNGLAQAGFPFPTVVVGYGAEQIESVVGDRCGLVRQPEQLGTGHAVRVGLEALPAGTDWLLVVHGDEPLISPDMLRAMLTVQSKTDAAIVLLTVHAQDTRNFGRVVRDASGRPCALVQEGDLTPEQRSINEVNLGAYVFNTTALKQLLPRMQSHAPKGEFYLTDVVAMAADAGLRLEAVVTPEGSEIMGVNDLMQLEQASLAVYRRTAQRLMNMGVTILDSASTFVDEDVEIGSDTVILPFTMISGKCQIGRSCRIGPSARVLASRIGNRCRVEASTIEESELANGVSVGPYAHVMRASLADGAEIGAQSQIKRSTVGARSRMHHFGYVGDARIGANVNIGAGTVTCNYDGTAKHQTTIGDGAFIGSGTLLRAPVEVGAGAATGAGAVILHNVPPNSLAVGMPARVLKSVERSPAGELSPQTNSEGESKS